MSLRTATYHASPSTPPSSSFSQTKYPFPSRSGSPRSSQAQHQAQLASYQRDPAKNPSSPTRPVLYPTSKRGRPRRPDLEDGSSDEDNGKVKDASWKRRWRAYISSIFLGKRTSKRRYLLYIVAVLAVYFIILQPLTASRDLDLLGASSNRTTSGKGKGKRSSHGVYKRAPLPSEVIKAKTSDHKMSRGLLLVEPESKIHPIYQLIKEARENWDAKIARQSKTLEQAVNEYKRRYHRNPPKGFDKWWDYVAKNDVQLPDEYDQILKDLMPFYALSPKDLQLRLEETAQMPDTYTVRIRHGSIRSTSRFDVDEISGADDRQGGQIELLRPVARYLPDLLAVYSVHDTPTQLISWDHRRELMEHVEEHEWIDRHDEVDTTLRGWHSACPPTSLLRRAARHYSGSTYVPHIPSTTLTGKSFIADHAAQMDICNHPDIVPLHGVLANRYPQAGPLRPLFSLSKTNLHADILAVPTEQYVEDVPSIPWEERDSERLLWRGSNTGAFYEEDWHWRASHRTRLVAMCDSQQWLDSENLTLLPAPKTLRGLPLGRTVQNEDWTEAAEHYLDMAFTGEAIQCEEEDGTCEDLRNEYRWEYRMDQDEAAQYKYIIDVDGNAWSARFKRLLSSGSLIFKSTIMPEWWTDRIQPWVHYIPVKVDYADLFDSLAFFQGNMQGKGGEEALAKDIAEAGQEWSLTHWRREDMTAYAFRLYLEWGRIVSDRRSSMDFVLDNDDGDEYE